MNSFFVLVRVEGLNGSKYEVKRRGRWKRVFEGVVDGVCERRMG